MNINRLYKTKGEDNIMENEKAVKEHIMKMFKCVDSYESLAIFISHYKDLISKI